MKDQGFTSWEILWEQDGDYDFGWIAGDKEIELQKQYGYKIDSVHYQISRNNRPKFTKEQMQKGGITNINSGHLQRLNTNLGIKKRKLTQLDAESIRLQYDNGVKLMTLSRKYNVAPIAIRRIINFITYKRKEDQ